MNLQPTGTLDYIVLAWLALGLYGGFRAGFVRALTQFVGAIGAWLGAALLTPATLRYLDARWQIVAWLERWLPLGEDAAQVLAPGGAQTADGAVPLLAQAVAAVVVFIGLMIVLRLLFGLAGGGLDILVGMLPLRGVNRVAGALFAGARNLVVAAVVLGVLLPATAIAGLAWLRPLLEESTYAGMLINAFNALTPWLFGDGALFLRFNRGG